MEPKKPRHIVVVGSSAGGIDALSRLVATVPADFPAPIVMAQHLDPNRPSHLPEILARRAQLPIRSIEDRDRLTGGTVYVVPAHHNVEIRDGEVYLTAEAGGRPQPSIDLLLASAASAYGEHVTAVILTGSGSDGADGARRVKAAGGTVVIQNPDTAEFASMPQSLAPTTVDIVAEIDSIGALLADLVTQPPIHPPGADGDAQLDGFLGKLRDESGFDFSAYKRPTIRRRLRSRLTATGTADLERYVAYLSEHPDEFQRLTSSFLLKVTEFFRDEALFERLRAEWLPELLDDARRRGEELRIWSAGCATGEEAYSVAMLVADLRATAKNPPAARVFATDLDDTAIRFARRGIYPSSALDNIPADLRERYVTVLDGQAEVTKAVRSLVIFGQHDLGSRAPFPAIDLILCRNVLIYFQPELQQRTLRLFAFSLRDGGYLALGKAETTGNLRGSFKLVDRRLKVYRRAGPRQAHLTMQLSQPARPSPPSPARHVAPALDLAVGRARQEIEQRRAAADRTDRLLLALQTGVVVVDQRYDILRINAAAREMLSIHGTATGDDFVHLAVGVSSSELRDMIDAALRGQAGTAVFHTTTTASAAGEGADLELSCTPIGAGVRGEPSVLIEVRDVSAAEARRRVLERELAERDHRLEDQAARLQRSADTHRQLIAANREQTDAVALLQASNDELVVSNEEVQASTEEVETLNEELQATNEELETLNEELQATVEELNSTNAELETRTVEIEEANESLAEERQSTERQRLRLATMMASMGDAVMMVDEHGEALLTNDAYDDLFTGVEADSVLEVTAGEPMPSRKALQRRAAAGESFVDQFALRAPDGSRRWFEAIGRPLRATGGELGGVVVIRDITDRSLRELQDEFVAMVAHELRTPLTAMSGYVELLRRQLPEGDPDDRLHRFADRAVVQARRMSDQVGDLLDANRLQRGGLDFAFEPVDLAGLTAEMVEMTRSLDDEVEIGLRGSRRALPVVGDPGRLQQVVLNLLSNATHHGGGRIEVSLGRRGSHAELRIRDHGPGISEADLPQLFTRFFQGGGRSKGGGMGLGLYISREIVEAHGGTIEARSGDGAGATFVVLLPITDQPA